MSYQLSNFNVFYIIICSILNKSAFKLNIFYLNILMNFHMTFLTFTKYFKRIYIFDIFVFSNSVYQFLLLHLFVYKISNFYLIFDISLKLKPFMFFMIFTSLALTTFVIFFGKLSKIFLYKVYTIFLHTLQIFSNHFVHILEKAIDVIILIDYSIFVTGSVFKYLLLAILKICKHFFI